MPVPNYKYITGTARGVPGKEVDASVFISREEAVILDTHNTIVSTERFDIRGVKLPLFDGASMDWEVAIDDGDALSVPTTASVDFGGGFLYDYHEVADAVTAALETIAASLAIDVADRPKFFFDSVSNKFSFETTSDFRTGYTIYVSPRFEWALNTFRYETTLKAGLYPVRLKQDSQPQSVATLSFLTPVARIALRTDSLPVVSELLPTPGGGVLSNETGVFLVDYKYLQRDNQSLAMIEWSANSTDHRWHNLQASSAVRQFRVNFSWVDYEDRFHPLKMREDSYLELKILFYTPKLDIPHL